MDNNFFPTNMHLYFLKVIKAIKWNYKWLFYFFTQVNKLLLFEYKNITLVTLPIYYFIYILLQLLYITILYFSKIFLYSRTMTHVNHISWCWFLCDDYDYSVSQVCFNVTFDLIVGLVYMFCCWCYAASELSWRIIIC